LREHPLKNACFAARGRETARASAKLTEFCKRLKNQQIFFFPLAALRALHI